MSRDTSFYYSFLVLPPHKRRAIVAVWDFCRAVDDAVDGDETSERVGPSDGSAVEALEPAMVGAEGASAHAHDTRADPKGERSDARRQLALWRQELARVYSDQTKPQTSQGQALAPLVRAFALPREEFELLVDGVEMDLERVSYPTFEALLEYCRRVAGTVGLVCLNIFGGRSPGARDYALNLATALQLTNIVRDVAEDLRRGRVYLPLEDLSRFGVTEEDLRRGVVNTQVHALLAFECQRARSYYQRASELLPANDRRRLVAAEIMGGIYYGILQRIERNGYDVFSSRIRVPRPARLVIALRIWACSLLGIPTPLGR